MQIISQGRPTSLKLGEASPPPDMHLQNQTYLCQSEGASESWLVEAGGGRDGVGLPYLRGIGLFYRQTFVSQILPLDLRHVSFLSYFFVLGHDSDKSLSLTHTHNLSRKCSNITFGDLDTSLHCRVGQLKRLTTL